MTELTIEGMLNMGKSEMDKSIDHLKAELIKIRTGKASTSLLNGILVQYYGNPTPIDQVANVGIADSKTISVQPWEKSLLGPIEQAIFAANLGITPMNDGEFIRISIPPLTEERRINLVKQAKGLGEECKVSLRTIRHKLIEFVKKEVKNGYPEDAGKKREAEIQNQVNSYGDTVNKYLEAKEIDIMTV